MSDKAFDRLMDADQQLRRMPLDGIRGMFDGVLITIEFVRGFEMFNTRPYHNYEDWGDGYRVKTHDGVEAVAEDLDDALRRLREKLLQRMRDVQGPLSERSAAAQFVLADGRLGTAGVCHWREGEPHKVVWVYDGKKAQDPFNEDGTPHDHPGAVMPRPGRK